MSELKAYTYDDMIDGDADTNIEYYPKSEADKAIANRDYEIKNLKDSIGKLLKAKTEQVITEVMQKALIYGEGFVRVEDMMKLIAELRHQKYKRCLAMALLWLERTENSTDLENELVSRKRCSKWMELAEKFKEEKDGSDIPASKV